MSFTLRNCVLSICNKSFPRNFGDSLHLKSIMVQRSHDTLNRTFSQCKKSDFFEHHLRSMLPSTQMKYSISQPAWIGSKDESRELMAVWPDIVRELTDSTRYPDLPDVNKWLAKVLQYNVPGGKKSRALAAVSAYRSMASQHDLTEENLRLCRILGWCVELVQAFLLVLDDIEDKSITRRSQPCWYLYNDIGLAAVNDGGLLEMCIFQLLKNNFKDKSCYVDLVELFLDCIIHTEMGQCIDLMSTNFGKKPNLDLFTMDRYNAIVKYKTAFYTFVLPVTSAMYFANIRDPEMHRQAKTILLEMGHFFQVQDDYLDCYGTPEVTGKIGRDIEEGKCSWLIVVALQRATPQQKEILKECYGVNDPECVNRVKQVYNDIGVANTYSVYEEKTYNLLITHIQQISRGLPHDLFLKLLDKTYGRVA